MGVTCHVVLIETSGNQSFIFETTKRRENVGASELIYRLERWTRDALRDEFPGFDPDWRIIDGRDAQLLVAAAGGGKVVVRDPGRGRALVSRVTARALREAPGLDVCGVVGERFDWEGIHREADRPPVSLLARRCREVHEALPRVRADRPGPASRFPRIPIVDECAASGLPAHDVITEGEGPRSRQPRARPSLAKREARDAGFRRLADNAEISKEKLERIADHLEGVPDWVAVVHADGNSLGHLFTDLGTAGGGDTPSGSDTPGGSDAAVHSDSSEHSDSPASDGSPTSDRYADALGPFSKAVDACTVRAFRVALAHCKQVLPHGHDVDGEVPVLPLVLGGDDLTVICTGSVALAFTEAYLVAFEEATRDHPDIRQQAPDGLTACAGVAVVKPHFPFSAAYDLAEELTKEAKKTVKRYSVPHGPSADGSVDDPVDGSAAPDTPSAAPGGARQSRSRTRIRPRASAFSFHVLYDSGGSDPAHLRDRMRVAPGAADIAAEPDPSRRRELRALLYAQPYVVTRDMREPWTLGRHWDDLARRVAALTATVDPAAGTDTSRTGASRTGASGTGIDPTAGADDRKLPASQMHDLREALFSGRDAADGRFRQLLARYRDRGLDLFAGPGSPNGLGSRGSSDVPDSSGARDGSAAGTVAAGGDESLFWRISDQGLLDGQPGQVIEPPVTGLLDAMNAVHLMGDLPDRHNHTRRHDRHHLPAGADGE
ncbi:Cas10/Cmr2 second palm domain-containing protein, partial [Protofrankia coriariae]